MLTAKVNDGGVQSYERYYVVMGINEEALCRAKNIFDGYRAGGVILEGSFSDHEWRLTNQLTKMTLRFCPDELAFKRYTEKWLGCSYRCFLDGIKAYAVFHMGSLNLSSIKEIIRKLMQLAETPYEEVPVEVHMIEFLKLLPSNESKDQAIEDMEERLLFGKRKKNVRRQRVLADFSAYFGFNEALESFWSSADDKDKLFYFPLYFWWNLTTILPLRPTEFLLTPRQCLETKNGERILTIRRTVLKGGQKRIYYRIDGDYKLMKYTIPEKMAVEIEWYLRATGDMSISFLDTLFVQQPHYAYFDMTVSSASVYYSYQNLSYCLRRFQEREVGEDKGRINLGDTRHLAMISLIASGGSPVICRELAGHEDINISAHYYSNISRFVECATYEMHRKQKGGEAVEMLAHKPFSTSETVEVNGGCCDSAAYIAGSISDCIRNIGTGGELGNCIFCPHFIDGKSGKYLLFSEADGQKNQVDDDSRYLMHVLEMVRKGKGYNEDIQSALLNLQHSSSRYSKYLYEHMRGI